jgi:hypothetical protein
LCTSFRFWVFMGSAYLPWQKKVVLTYVFRAPLPITLIADVTTVDLAKCKSVGMNDYIQNLLIVTYSSLVRGLPNL